MNVWFFPFNSLLVGVTLYNFRKLINFNCNFDCRIDKNSCMSKVNRLFNGDRDLIAGFNTFLPEALELKTLYFGASEGR